MLVLTAAVITVTAVRWLRLPSLLAYILVGIAVGPYGLKWLPHTREATAFAHFGVVFLMFSIGLEFSVPRLLSMRRLVFGLGLAQVALTTLATMALAAAFGMPWQYGLALGSAVAMSSTAIVARLLDERRELHSTAGQQTMGVLLFQDLAVIPLLIVIPALGSEAPRRVFELGEALLKAVAILAVLILFGQKLMQGWFDLVARRKSRELFMLNVLWLVVGLAFLTSWGGLTLALGAFIGGVLISETVYRHQVAGDIRPFRDVLLGLFFVTVGMQLNLGYVAANFAWVVALVALLVLGKGLIVLGLARAMGNHLSTALATALQLAQGGEFGLILAALAADVELLDAATQQVALAAMLLSMLMTPVLIDQGRKVVVRLARGHTAETLRDIRQQARQVDQHVIICGYGRMGQSVARFLGREHIPFIALDTDLQRVRQARAGGEQVVFGDADRREVLLAAGLLRARAVVLAYADVGSALEVLRLARDARADLPVIVRAKDDSQIDLLKKAGATEVVPEILEGGLMLAMQTLGKLGIPTDRTMRRVREIRGERYELLRHFYRAEGDQPVEGLPEPRRTIAIPPSARAVGRPYHELDLARFSVKLVGCVRRGVRSDQPSEDAQVEAGDVLILAGASQKLEAAERFLLTGSDIGAAAQ